MSRWYRAYEGTVTDAKIGEIALVVECSRSVVIATWHAILESCATTNDGGRFSTTPRRVAAVIGEPPSVLQSVFDEMGKIGLLEGDKVCSWQRWQRDLRPSPLEWARIRKVVFERDDYTCTYCGERGGRLECDHVFPVSRGGGHEEENLATACFACNRSKRSKTLEEWRAA